MEQLYYDIAKPGSLSGVRTFVRYSGKSEKTAKRFLQAQPAYTMHRPVRRKFLRRKTFSKGIGDLYQADLAEMGSLARDNDGIRYLLTCIDVFSKMAWVVPLRTKEARTVADAFEWEIIAKCPPRMLQTDKGSEWVNGIFQSMLTRHGIHFYTSENSDIKAAVVERFNRTLKERIYRYMTYKNSRRYVDVLQDIVTSYNHTWHRSIRMAPSEVCLDNADEVAALLYPPKPRKFFWKLKVGDHVRVSEERRVFAKGYAGSWSTEIFRVKERYPTVPVTYSLNDAPGETIKGRWYEWELQFIVPPSDDYYHVEKILKTRKRGKRIEYFVKWLGYPDSMNSWTDAVRQL